MPLSTMFRLTVSSVWLAVFASLALSIRVGAKEEAPDTAAQAERVLTERCVKCHGQNGAALKNVFVLDRNRLIASRIVVPGDPGSLLLKMVESNAMPPGGPALSDEEKTILRAWVLAGAPQWNAKTVSANGAFVDERKLIALIDHDLLNQPQRSRPFLRYFSLVHLYNAGLSELDLETYRAALGKLINSLSWHKEITGPAVVDSTRTVFRIDLRDYNWTSATWDLLLSAYPYGLRSAEGSNITRISGAQVPYVRADWFAASASVPPLYHDLLGLPRLAADLERQLGVDVSRDLAEEKNVARAGLRASGVSQNNRVLERHVSPHGAYWKSFDFRSNLDDQNIFKDPLQLNPAGGEIIFNLPNGLQAYFLLDAFGRRLDAAPIAIVADRNNADDPVIRNGRSCMSCHYAGVQAFKDDVRPVVRGLPFASFDREKVLAIYPPQETLDSLTERDRRRFERAVEQLGALSISAQTEPINALSRRFLSEMPVAQAAAEAGLDTVEFQARIARSSRLLALGYGQLLVAGGGIKRDAWDRHFVDLARELELGDHVSSLMILPRRAAPSTASALNPAGSGIRPTARTGGIGADPASIMRSARTISVRSMTVYLEAEQLESELRKRPEFKTMELAIVKDEKLADISIEINRAEFSFNYAFTATNPQTSMVVASGQMTAWNGDFAAPRIAKDFLKQMQAVREPLPAAKQ